MLAYLMLILNSLTLVWANECQTLVSGQFIVASSPVINLKKYSQFKQGPWGADIPTEKFVWYVLQNNGRTLIIALNTNYEVKNLVADQINMTDYRLADLPAVQAQVLDYFKNNITWLSDDMAPKLLERSHIIAEYVLDDLAANNIFLADQMILTGTIKRTQYRAEQNYFNHELVFDHHSWVTLLKQQRQVNHQQQQIKQLEQLLKSLQPSLKFSLISQPYSIKVVADSAVGLLAVQNWLTQKGFTRIESKIVASEYLSTPIEFDQESVQKIKLKLFNDLKLLGIKIDRESSLFLKRLPDQSLVWELSLQTDSKNFLNIQNKVENFLKEQSLDGQLSLAGIKLDIRSIHY